MRFARYVIPFAILVIGLFGSGAYAQNDESEKKSATQNEGTSAPVPVSPDSNESEKRSATPNEVTSTAAVPSRQATVFFKRESAFLGAANDAKVFIDGKQVCAIASGKECKVDVEPGKRIVKIDAALSAGEFSRAFELKPEKTYSFAVSVRSAGVLAGGLGGLFGMIADNNINQSATGKDNGVFTAKLIEEK